MQRHSDRAVVRCFLSCPLFQVTLLYKVMPCNFCCREYFVFNETVNMLAISAAQVGGLGDGEKLRFYDSISKALSNAAPAVPWLSPIS